MQFWAGGGVGTRAGFAKAFDTPDPTTSLFNWISSLGNLLLWYRSTDRSVRGMDIEIATTEVGVIAGDLVGYGASFVEAGARLFLSFFTTGGVGASGARVLTFQDPNLVNDLAFRPPLTYVPPAPSEPGAGTVTAGLHNLGYRVEHRSGFIGRLSPDSGVGAVPSLTTFVPVQFTAAGAKRLSWTLTTTWPIDAVNVYAVMTPVASPSDYRLVPGAVKAVVGGVLSAITFTIDISDDLLLAFGDDSTDALSLFTNSVADVPQFFPSTVLTHGNRMVYVTQIVNNVGGLSSALFVSDTPTLFKSYQSVDPARSIIQLPSLRRITTAASIDNTLFIFGPTWTYRTSDNGRDPSTWATPALVDGRRGTLSVRGVEVSPAGTYAWVAMTDGLYFFPGSYPSLPISYYQQPTWDRIDWNQSHIVQVKDDPGNKIVQVMAPLAASPDGKSPAGIYIMSWCYTGGFTPDRVLPSLPDFIQSYDMGSMEIVTNGLPNMPTQASQQDELWLGSSTAGGILRRASLGDPEPYFDNGLPIASTYETSLYPPQGTSQGTLQHHGADYRLTGSGVIDITVNGLDRASSEDLLQIQLSGTPGYVTHRSFDLISEGVSHRFTQGRNLVMDIGDVIAPPETPVPVTLKEDNFVYAGVPLVLAFTPQVGSAIILMWGVIFQQQIPANYTVAGNVVTLINANYLVGDTITIIYPIP